MRELTLRKFSQPFSKILDFYLVLPYRISFILFFSLLVAAYNYLFIIYFRPFRIESSDAIRAWLSAGYASITMLSLLSFLVILRKKISNRSSNTLIIKPFIPLTIILLLTISLFSWLFTKTIADSYIEPYSLFDCFAFVGLIASIPLIFLILLAQNWRLKTLKFKKGSNKETSTLRVIEKNIDTATLNEISSKEIAIHADQGIQSVPVIPGNFICAISDENYCNIYYLKEENVEMSNLRITLTSIQLQMKPYPLFRCHRSALINTLYLERVFGNTKSKRVQLKYISEFTLPVSRKLAKLPLFQNGKKNINRKLTTYSMT